VETINPVGIRRLLCLYQNTGRQNCENTQAHDIFGSFHVFCKLNRPQNSASENFSFLYFYLIMQKSAIFAGLFADYRA